jgi:hypothetical protein
MRGYIAWPQYNNNNNKKKKKKKKKKNKDILKKAERKESPLSPLPHLQMIWRETQERERLKGREKSLYTEFHINFFLRNL